MVNPKKPQGSVKKKDAAQPTDAQLVSEFRKENARLQNLIAKTQVAHESEINKLNAEHAAELQKIRAYRAPKIIIQGVAAKDGKPA